MPVNAKLHATEANEIFMNVRLIMKRPSAT